MGSDRDDAFDNEQPVHTVFVDGFYMDIKPVTNRQYQRFVVETGHPPPFLDRQWASEFNWKGLNFPEGMDDLPVVLVNWHDAQSYAKWAGKRLPTEAEWEKAARGGLVQKKFPYGDKLRFNQANFDKGYFRKKRLEPVGSYPPNKYGLYDMAGNVWQWCQDWYGENYYSASKKHNPKGPVEGVYRVFRGGSWKSLKRFLRTSQRGKDIPEVKCVTIGFRCALSQDKTPGLK